MLVTLISYNSPNVQYFGCNVSIAGQLRPILVKPITTGNKTEEIKRLFVRMLYKTRINLIFEITKFHNTPFLAQLLTAW